MNVIVTGASRGIGRGIATALARAGHRVGLIARDKAVLNEVADLIREAGGVAEVAACDISNAEATKESVSELVSALGGLDALINNAGIVTRKSIDDLSEEEWVAMVNANVHGPFYMVRAALPHLRANGQGRIINISSISGKVPLPGGSGYAATKYALTGLSQSLFLELRAENIAVTTLYPGSVNSASHRHDATADHSWKVQPEEIGQVCCDILSMRLEAVVSDVEVRPLNRPKG